MEPRKSMTRYAAFVCVMFLVRAAAGGGDAVALGGLAFLILGMVLDGGYRLAIKRRNYVLTNAGPRPTRRKRDKWARAQWVVVSLFGIVVGLAFSRLGASTFSFGSSRLSAFANATLTAATIGSSAVLASALVDWFWVLPRVSGIAGEAPCELAGQERWARTTGIWLFHRSVATLVVAGAVTGVALYMADTAKGTGGKTAWFVVGGVFVTAVAPFVNSGAKALWLAFNPVTTIGDTVDIHGRNCIVVDVSLQGAKYLLPGSIPRSDFDRKEDGSFSLDDFGRYPRDADSHAPCASGCVRANWYCHHNPAHGD